ncbi:hypothetical protein A2U01_0077232, partial [Trifolium medium]|nr:hypothetical protein [Trifolium medium]
MRVAQLHPARSAAYRTKTGTTTTMLRAAQVTPARGAAARRKPPTQ